MNTKPRTTEEIAEVTELFAAASRVPPDKAALTALIAKTFLSGFNAREQLTTTRQEA